MTVEQLTHATDSDWIGNEYSGCCPFSPDNSKVLLVNRDHFALFTPDGAKLADLPIQAGQEPRWLSNDELVYVTDSRYGTKAQLMKYSLTHQLAYNITTFPYQVISGRGESDICADGDRFALVGDDREIILYSLKHGKEASYFQSEPFDWLKITTKAKILIGGDEIGTIVQPGQRLVTTFNGHAAVATYQGHDIMLWCSSKDPVANQNAVVLFNLDDSKEKPRAILHLPWGYAFHVATCAQNWCVVSAYDKTGALPFQIWRVWYDGRPGELLHEYVAEYRDYTSQPKFALSRDGSMGVYSVDDGRTVNTWLMKLDSVQPLKPVLTETRIDYAPYVGKSEFVLIPRTDGAVDIVERKLK